MVLACHAQAKNRRERGDAAHRLRADCGAGIKLAAGTYTRWTLPHRAGTTELIVNEGHGHWGTEYDSIHDIARARLAVDLLAAPVEQFTHQRGPDGCAARSATIRVWAVPVVGANRCAVSAHHAAGIVPARTRLSTAKGVSYS